MLFCQKCEDILACGGRPDPYCVMCPPPPTHAGAVKADWPDEAFELEENLSDAIPV